MNFLFTFVPNGRIIIFILNVPIIFHDNTMEEYTVYGTLREKNMETSGKVMVDSAFKLGSYDFLVKSSHDIGDGDCDDILVNTVATPMR